MRSLNNPYPIGTCMGTKVPSGRHRGPVTLVILSRPLSAVLGIPQREDPLPSPVTEPL